MATDLSLTNEQALAIDKLGGIAVSQEGAGDSHPGRVLAVAQDLSTHNITGKGDDEGGGAAPNLGLETDFGGVVVDGDLGTVIKELRRPFTPAAVKWKVQTTFGRPEPHTALIVGYIDARLVVERLNLVCAASWHEGDASGNPALPPFQPVDWSKGGMLCRLTVCGVTRQDVGFGKDAKSIVSDALKRAAVKFGIGVSVYATPQIRLHKDSGHVKSYKPAKGDATLVLTDGGKEYLPKFYTRWLWEHGVEAFGLPLDHGDSALSVGDVDSGLELGTEEDPEVDEETASGIAELSKSVTKGKK